MRFDSTGGGIHVSAVIGHPPELRDWRPGHGCFAPEIHESARVHAFVSVDAGAVRPTYIGPRSWLLKHSHVGHDAVIGADVEIAPGAVVGGEVVIGDGVNVGMNACIKPRVTVGAGARIGMGAVVLRDVPAGVTVVGNPARPIKNKLEVVA